VERAIGAFDLQGHRGARGLAPENTLDAFAAALGIGVSTLELDTAVTSDGVVVVAHDRRLNPDITRGPDGRWIRPPAPAVHQLSFAELERYDVGRIDPGSAYAKRFPSQRGKDGVRMPTLASVLQLARWSNVRFNVETKISPLAPDETPSPQAFADALLAVVLEAGMAQRVTIQSFDWRTLLIVQKTEPRVATSYLTAADYISDESPWAAGFRLREHGSLLRMIRAAAKGAADATWSPDWRDLSEQAVTEAKALGLKVLPWTLNEPADMERMIDWGVTGFITDYPDRAREVMRRKGLPLPPEEPVEG
jgi:glycerophosphoryl diester phosphodiesterase